MPQYMADVNACMTSMVTIEHPDAIEAASAIATVPGLDVAIIGPGDLATSMGYMGDSSQPAVREAIERAEGALLNSAVALGGVAKDPDAAMAMVRRGYKMIFLGVDAMFLARGAAAALGNLSTAAARC
jgi:4-hydroxy-2-oxoheptanedioate aldolase